MSEPRGTVVPVDVTGRMDATKILESLDDDQRAVALETAGPVAVIAGAGTGKTRTITHRVAYAVATGQVDPQAVMALSFTTAAAQEMKTRLEAMGVHGVQCRTFHSAALRQAQYFWPLSYGVQLPQILEDPAPLWRQACERVGLSADQSLLSAIGAEISWTKQANVLPHNCLRQR